MSRRGNYGFERRRKEDARRAKQEAKRQRKIRRALEGSVGPAVAEPQENTGQPGRLEWFSPSRSRITTSEAGTRPASDPPDDWVLFSDIDEEPGKPS